jgi:uncharacterized protein YdeI (YjbR/CyaY-like superfamily)
MPAAADAPQIAIGSRADLRDWLARNHMISGTVWLSIAKKPAPDHVPYDQVVQELLCWGWIDSLPRSLNAERSLLMASPRNPKSAWSAINKGHVMAARVDGQMTPAGEALIAIAIANGTWDFLNDVEALVVPADLAAALNAARATAMWDSFPRTVKRGTLEQIKMAKTGPIRAARIAEAADSAAQGVRPKAFRR